MGAVRFGGELAQAAGEFRGMPQQILARGTGMAGIGTVGTGTAGLSGNPFRYQGGGAHQPMVEPVDEWTGHASQGSGALPSR